MIILNNKEIAAISGAGTTDYKCVITIANCESTVIGNQVQNYLFPADSYSYHDALIDCSYMARETDQGIPYTCSVSTKLLVCDENGVCTPSNGQKK
jgi:hypothetical protein